MRIFDCALHVGNVLKSFPKHRFLVGAMRTPVKPIHLRLPRGQAFGESIVLVITVVPIAGIGQNKRHHNPNPDQPFPRRRVRLGISHAPYLPLAPFFRHDSLPARITSYITSLTRLCSMLRASYPTPRSATSTLRRPPSHPRALPNRIPLALPPSAPPKDARCAYRHKALASSASGPAAQWHPSGHIQSGRC